MSEVFSIVKPNNTGKGNTLQFSLCIEKRTDQKKNPTRCIFLTAAKQKEDTKVENARFDYENKIVMKLGFLDIGKMLRVLSGKVEKEAIIHKFDSSVTKIEISVPEDKKYSGFFMRVGRKEGEKVSNVSIGISDDEAIVLEILLKDALCKMYWGE